VILRYKKTSENFNFPSFLVLKLYKTKPTEYLTSGFNSLPTVFKNRSRRYIKAIVKLTTKKNINYTYCDICSMLYQVASTSFNLLTPGAFCKKGVFWTFWRFSAWISAKLSLIWSKMHLQHDSLPFLPLASRFMTFFNSLVA